MRLIETAHVNIDNSTLGGLPNPLVNAWGLTFSPLLLLLSCFDLRRSLSLQNPNSYTLDPRP